MWVGRPHARSARRRIPQRVLHRVEHGIAPARQLGCELRSRQVGGQPATQLGERPVDRAPCSLDFLDHLIAAGVHVPVWALGKAVETEQLASLRPVAYTQGGSAIRSERPMLHYETNWAVIEGHHGTKCITAHRYTLGRIFERARGPVMLNPIVMRIEQLLVTMMTASVPSTPELDALFNLLRGASDPGDRADAEQRIWAIWSGHEDADAAGAMRGVIAAFESGDLLAADRELNMMVDRWPNWAEAWNRRATLRFIEERDVDSLNDIRRTLELEPRHFGALSGFGQICLRAREISSALLAFEHAVAVNPNMESIRQVAEVLRRQDPRTIH